MRKTILIVLLITVVNIFCSNISKNNKYFGQKPPGLIPIVFAPNKISTDKFEFAGTFSADGTEYYFTRRPTAKGSANRIYYTSFNENNNSWTKPELAPFAKDIFEFEPHITSDNSQLFFASSRSKPSKFKGNGEIWVTKRDNNKNKWTNPEYLDSPINDGFAMYLTSSKNKTLYFTWFNKGNRGIFKSNYKDGKYLKPEKLPEEINSNHAAHPFISKDESFLIFDSQIAGRGKPELYISFKDKEGNWSKAIKFGAEINSTQTEMSASLSPDGKYLFFHRVVNGNGDIYWVDAKVIDELKP